MTRKQKLEEMGIVVFKSSAGGYECRTHPYMEFVWNIFEDDVWDMCFRFLTLDEQWNIDQQIMKDESNG